MLNKEALKQWKMIKTVTRLQHSWRSSHYFKACDDVDKRLLQSHHQLIKTIIKMVSCIRVLSAMTMHKRSFPNNGLAYSSIDIFRVHTYMFRDIFLRNYYASSAFPAALLHPCSLHFSSHFKRSGTPIIASWVHLGFI